MLLGSDRGEAVHLEVIALSGSFFKITFVMRSFPGAFFLGRFFVISLISFGDVVFRGCCTEKSNIAKLV